MYSKSITYCFLISLMALALFFATRAHPNKKTWRMPTSADAYYLTDSERDALIQKSINGDALAAHRLYQYFAMSVHDMNSMYYWEHRAAEMGDQNMQEDLVRASKNYELTNADIVVLSDKVDKGDIQAAHRLSYYYQVTLNDEGRSYYWLARSADLGDKDAQESLIRFDARLERKQAK